MRENYYSKVTHWPVKDPSFLRFFRLQDFYEITIYISQTPRWNSGNPNIGRDPSVFGWTFYLLLKSSLFEPRKFDTSFPKLITSHSGHPKVAFWGVLFTCKSGGNIFQRRDLGNWNDTRSSTPQKKLYPPKLNSSPLKNAGLAIRSFPKLGFGNFSGGHFVCETKVLFPSFWTALGSTWYSRRQSRRDSSIFFFPHHQAIYIEKKQHKISGKPPPSSNNWGNKNWRCHWFKGKFGIKSSINPP